MKLFDDGVETVKSVSERKIWIPAQAESTSEPHSSRFSTLSGFLFNPTPNETSRSLNRLLCGLSRLFHRTGQPGATPDARIARNLQTQRESIPAHVTRCKRMVEITGTHKSRTIQRLLQTCTERRKERSHWESTEQY